MPFVADNFWFDKIIEIFIKQIFSHNEKATFNTISLTHCRYDERKFFSRIVANNNGKTKKRSEYAYRNTIIIGPLFEVRSRHNMQFNFQLCFMSFSKCVFVLVLFFMEKSRKKSTNKICSHIKQLIQTLER